MCHATAAASVSSADSFSGVPVQLRKLVQAGVVRSVAALLAEPKGMHAAIDALVITLLQCSVRS